MLVQVEFTHRELKLIASLLLLKRTMSGQDFNKEENDIYDKLILSEKKIKEQVRDQDTQSAQES